MKSSATLVKSAICRTNVKHRPAPSLFYFPGITSSPFWAAKSCGYAGLDARTQQPIISSAINSDIIKMGDCLRNNFESIRNEYLLFRKNNETSDFDTSKDRESLYHGRWDWNSFILRGKWQESIKKSCPITFNTLESISHPRVMTGTPFSFTFYSTLAGNSTINAHFGPCNLRLRCHLPLIVPKGDCHIRVGDNVVQWKEGEPLFFDDCYDHEGTLLILLSFCTMLFLTLLY